MKKKEKIIEEENIKKEVKVEKIEPKKKKRKKKRLKQSDIKKYSMTELDHVISKIKANEVKYTVISVLIILISFFIIAYIIFSSVQEHVSHNVFKDGNLYIKFLEKENGLGDIIDLVDVSTYSTGDMVLDTYEVTITNDSSDVSKYQIFIEDDIDMIEIDNCKDIFLDRSYLRYNVNDGVDMTLSDDEDNSIIFGSLSGGKSITYTIKVWVSDTYIGDTHYHGKLVVKQVKEKDQID